MIKQTLMNIAIAGAALVVPLGAVAAQTANIVGQTVQVQTNGVMNSIYFSPDGTATITTPSGTTMPGTWTLSNNTLCLSAMGGQECWPYTQAFQMGQQVTLTSSCQQVSTFMPQWAPPPPMQQPAGERG